MRTFYSHHFGCRVNEAEKEVLDTQMLEAGFRYVKDQPDVFFINTCAVTHKAEREARQLIYQTKRRSPKTKIVVTGCAATYWQKNKLYRDLPIDLLVDNLNKDYLVTLIKKRFFPTSPRGYAGQAGLISSKFLSSGRHLIKIQDGCQRFCTFCIVPYLRGLPKSFTIEQIINQINKSRNTVSSFPKKISEVILTAINTEAFGYDTNEKFIDLVAEVVRKTSIPRVSFGSIHPWSINEEFFALYKKLLRDNRLVNFFHIPLQSGSNTVLALMKRGYKSEEFLEKLRTIEKINPLIFISTDIIVGFLGEGEREFEETYNFLEKSPIVKFHIFRFSKRQNTAAYFMAKRISEPDDKTKIKRAKILAELSKKKYHEFQRKNIGRVTTALVLNKNDDGIYRGVLDNQLPVVINSESKKINPAEIIKVKVTELKNGILLVKPILH